MSRHPDAVPPEGEAMAPLPREQDAGNGQHASRKRRVRWVAGGVTVLVLSAGGAAAVGLINAVHSEAALCEREVVKVLKAPATARFDDPKVAARGLLHTVRGNVDSENGFGALLREQYVCVVKRVDSDWHLEGLRIGDRVTLMTQAEKDAEQAKEDAEAEERQRVADAEAAAQQKLFDDASAEIARTKAMPEVQACMQRAAATKLGKKAILDDPTVLDEIAISCGDDPEQDWASWNE
jgi:hypothetical protein